MRLDARATSPGDVRRLQLLSAIRALAKDRVRENVKVDAIREELSSRGEELRDHVQDDLKQLKRYEHADFFESLGGIGSAVITPTGLDVAKEFDARRLSVMSRRVQLRDDFLCWLYREVEENDRSPSSQDFLKSGAHYLGVPFTADDVSKAAEWLREMAFIKGQGSWQSPAPLRPTLTAKGKWTVENHQSVNDVTRPATVQNFSTTVHGNANVANASSDFTQHLDASQRWVVEASRLLDTVMQAKPAFEAHEQSELDALVAEARITLEEPEAPGRSRVALSKVAEFLNRVSAGALGDVLAGQVKDLLANLPL